MCRKEVLNLVSPVVWNVLLSCPLRTAPDSTVANFFFGLSSFGGALVTSPSMLSSLLHLTQRAAAICKFAEKGGGLDNI